jgi:hypothetical protein
MSADAGRTAALRDLAANLRAGLALAFLRAPSPHRLRAGPAQLFLLYLFALALGAGYDLYSVGLEDGRVDILALPVVSFWALAMLFAAGAVAALCAAPAVALPLAVAGFALVCWESAVAYTLAVGADFSPVLDRAYPTLSWVPVAWFSGAFGVAAVRMAAAAPRPRRAAVFVLAALLLAAPQWTVNPSARLWSATASAESDVEGDEAPQSEQTLYGQMEMLDDALDAVAPGQAGVTELFTISFAGDGGQEVFSSEAAGADAVLADVFDSGEHGVVLANSAAHPQERPFATLSSLQRALATMADRMNGDEDVLALFLTSHGTADHHLVVSLPPYQFEDLTPERLRSMLDDAGIRYRVIIVSACYSGAFLEPLAGPDTMVITASTADRTSLGCRTGAQWSDFGRAYFAEALAQTGSFEGAFRIASQRIAERETREKLTPSLPQISVGAGIRDQLQRLETRRGGRILFADRSGAGKPLPKATLSKAGASPWL